MAIRDDVEEQRIKVEQATVWYSNNRAIYKDLASSVADTIGKVLNRKKITYHTITSRAKDVERYRDKALRNKYDDPRSQIMDMAGVRIITYIDSDAMKVAEIVKSLFEIKSEFSADKTKELKPNQVGYRSIHYICTLGKVRSALDENEIYKGMLFEIQIRTILQHAWAEFEHDRNYKFKGVLPEEIKRRLFTVAGTLELMDWTFESISNEIDQYTHDVEESIPSGDLSVEITSASLRVYLIQKLKRLIDIGMKPDLSKEDEVKIISELSKYGIKNLSQLDALISDDFVDAVIKYHIDATFIGLLRCAMIVSNADNYFANAWDESWNRVDKGSFDLLQHYNISEESLREYLRNRSTLITS